MKDHIENIRMVLEGISPRRVEIVQNTDYYPFGQEFEYNNLDKNKYLFGGKEIEDSWTDWEGKLLPLYDFGYRYYGTPELRWGGVDPLSENYYSLSSYIYCKNNPIRHYDPDGRKIEEGSKKEWDKRKKNILDELDELNEKIEDLYARAEAEGWSSTKLFHNLLRLTGRVSLLSRAVGYMGKLELSSQIYSLNPNRGQFNITYNKDNGYVMINYNKASTASFIHEMVYAAQYENKELGFDRIDGDGYFQDVYKEIEAYKIQWAFNPASVEKLTSIKKINSWTDINVKWVQGIIEDENTPYAPGGSSNTGIIPLNVNSTFGDILRAYPHLAPVIQDRYPSDRMWRDIRPVIYKK